MPRLTSGQCAVLELVAREGLRVREIAERLYLSERAVTSRLYAAYEALGVHSLGYAAAWWEREHGEGRHRAAVEAALEGCLREVRELGAG